MRPAGEAVRAALSRPGSLGAPRSAWSWTEQLQPGEPIVVNGSFSTDEPTAVIGSATLHCRRVNQAEPWRTLELTSETGRLEAAIPGEYTDSPFPIQFYFELRDARSQTWLDPGLDRSLRGPPYYLIRRAKRRA